MADDKRSTSGDRRRRPTPTIDLSATEVKAAEAPPQPDSTEDDKDEAPKVKPPSTFRVIVTSFLLVGAMGVVAGAALWFLLANGRPTNDLSSRVAALETQSKAAPKSIDNTAVKELTARLNKIEQTAATAKPPEPASGERLAAIESSLKALGVTLAALNRRADTAAKATEALGARLDAIERSAKATQDKVAQNSGADVLARRALAALALRDTVTRGVPYAAELAIVKQLGADPQSLAALEPFASSGLPSEPGLSRDLRALLPKMVEASGADASRGAGFFERLQANASKLVRVQPIGEPDSNDPSAVLARVEVKAVNHDLAGIEAELAKLPPKVRAPAADWSKKLAARDAALAAARKLAADSAAALGAR